METKEGKEKKEGEKGAIGEKVHQYHQYHQGKYKEGKEERGKKRAIISGIDLDIWLRFRETCYRLGLTHAKLFEEIFIHYYSLHPEFSEKARLVIEVEPAKEKEEAVEISDPDVEEFYAIVINGFSTNKGNLSWVKLMRKECAKLSRRAKLSKRDRNLLKSAYCTLNDKEPPEEVIK